MNPILRIRGALRSMGASTEQANEAADAIVDHSHSRRESDLRHQQMMAEMRQFMSDLRNEIVLSVLLIVGVAVGVLSVVIAVFS